MIHVNVTGRCGNQMFQYAFARKLAILNNDYELEFDFYNVKRWFELTGDSSFDDQLKSFNVLNYSSVFENNNVFETIASPKQKLAYSFDVLMRKVFVKLNISDSIWQAKNEKHLNKLGIYYHENPSTNPSITKQGEKLVKGYFENKYYFDDIRDILVKEFTPKFPEKEKNIDLYRIIKENESVCVSFRKWGEVSGEVKKEREVCGKEYYQKAISEILTRVHDATLIIFSDDVNWVKENYDFGDTPVYYEDETDEIWEKMRLMYSCKHFIMTTSTFTWWAQYLCRNENKIVISPDHWYNSDKQSQLIDSSWVKVAP